MTRSFTMNKPCSVSMATWRQKQMTSNDVSITAPPKVSHPKRVSSGAGQASSKLLRHLAVGDWDLAPKLKGEELET